MLKDFQQEVKMVCLAVQVDQPNVMHVLMIQLRMLKNTAGMLILKLLDAMVRQSQLDTLITILSTTSGIVHTQRSSKI